MLEVPPAPLEIRVLKAFQVFKGQLDPRATQALRGLGEPLDRLARLVLLVLLAILDKLAH